MYVLVDMEWITDAHGGSWPTQLAAVRVDTEWNTVDAFSSLIYPKQVTFRQWNHMAFNGYTPSEFLEARNITAALYSFVDWLKADDILCWWHSEASSMLSFFTKIAHVREVAFDTKYLREYVYAALSGCKRSSGSPYQICAARSLRTPAPAHCSVNDIMTLQTLLQDIGLTQSDLTAPPKRQSKQSSSKQTPVSFLYLYDPETNLIHSADCEQIKKDGEYIGYSTFATPLRKRYKVCSCCRVSYLKAVRERNADIIERTNYNYVYAKRSGVFHKRGCPHALQAQDILGAVTYKACKQTGRRPCKHCCPSHKDQVIKPPSIISTSPGTKPPQKDAAVVQALGRFRRAKDERANTLERNTLSDVEKKTVLALSQPGSAFWASKGYSTFHRRNCPQLSGLNNLTGFSRYQDAVRAGYSPCRHCKPHPKQDAVLSIPINNQERSGESSATLVELCKANDIPYSNEGRYFYLCTSVGKWKIDTYSRPVRLEHINLVKHFGGRDEYHVQPRIFLSLKDAFDYVVRHDENLARQIEAEDSLLSAALC